VQLIISTVRNVIARNLLMASRCRSLQAVSSGARFMAGKMKRQVARSGGHDSGI